MGYYVNHCSQGHQLELKEKGQHLVKDSGFEKLSRIDVDSFKKFASEGKAILCEIDNGPFSALAFLYSPREADEFALDLSGRPKKFFIGDKMVVEKLSGFVSS